MFELLLLLVVVASVYLRGRVVSWYRLRGGLGLRGIGVPGRLFLFVAASDRLRKKTHTPPPHVTTPPLPPHLSDRPPKYDQFCYGDLYSPHPPIKPIKVGKSFETISVALKTSAFPDSILKMADIEVIRGTIGNIDRHNEVMYILRHRWELGEPEIVSLLEVENGN